MRDSRGVAVLEREALFAMSGDDVSPTRESRATDITKAVVPVPYMVTLMIVALGMFAAVWRIDTKISILEVREQSRILVEEANKRADSMQYDNMKQSVDELKRQTQLLQMQYAELSKQITSRR